jgi:general secretion pathway protein G
MKQNIRNKPQIKGFTLIELLVVIAIIGILSSVALVGLNTARRQGRDTRRIADLRQVQTALELYLQQNPTYPNGITDWSGLKTALSSFGTIPDDPLCPGGTCNSGWANSNYTYACDSTCTNYVLRARLETNHSVLANDVDGTVYNVACDDASNYYCIQMQ